MFLAKLLKRIENSKLDAAHLGLFRCTLGLVVMLKVSPLTKRIGKLFTENVLQVPFFSNYPLHSEQIATILCVFLLLSSTSLTLGFYSRTNAILSASCLSLTILIDRQLYSNHLYLIVLLLLLLGCSRCGERFSVDARNWSLRDNPIKVEAWPIELIKLQLSVVYFFAAITKINVSFLSGDLLRYVFVKESSWDTLQAIGQQAEWNTCFSTLAYLSVLTELFLCFALWHKRTRLLAVGIGVGFHLSLAFVYFSPSDSQLLVFSLVMFAVYSLHFDGLLDRPSTAQTNQQ